MKIKTSSTKRFWSKRFVLLGLLVASMSTIFVACEDPNENDDDEGVYYKKTVYYEND